MDAHLRPCIGEFLSCIQDPDLNVRRVALVALNSAAHNKPSLVRDLLPTTLPQLYDQTKIKVSRRTPSLVRDMLPTTLPLLYDQTKIKVSRCGRVKTTGWHALCNNFMF